MYAYGPRLFSLATKKPTLGDCFFYHLIAITFFFSIDHFRVVFSVTWPLNGNEAEGDLVLIQTSLLF